MKNPNKKNLPIIEEPRPKKDTPPEAKKEVVDFDFLVGEITEGVKDGAEIPFITKDLKEKDIETILKNATPEEIRMIAYGDSKKTFGLEYDTINAKRELKNAVSAIKISESPELQSIVKKVGIVDNKAIGTTHLSNNELKNLDDVYYKLGIVPAFASAYVNYVVTVNEANISEEEKAKLVSAAHELVLNDILTDQDISVIVEAAALAKSFESPVYKFKDEIKGYTKDGVYHEGIFDNLAKINSNDRKSEALKAAQNFVAAHNLVGEGENFDEVASKWAEYFVAAIDPLSEDQQNAIIGFVNEYKNLEDISDISIATSSPIENKVVVNKIKHTVAKAKAQEKIDNLIQGETYAELVNNIAETNEEDKADACRKSAEELVNNTVNDSNLTKEDKMQLIENLESKIKADVETKTSAEEVAEDEIVPNEIAEDEVVEEENTPEEVITPEGVEEVVEDEVVPEKAPEKVGITENTETKTEPDKVEPNEEEQQQLILKQNKVAKKKFDSKLKFGKRKKHKVLRIAATVLTTGVLGFMVYNRIIDKIYNSGPPVVDPFVRDNVWDNNDNDLEFDDSGNIVTDKMTDADKVIVTGQMGQLLFDDAHSRGQTDVGSVKQVLSISLLPYNLREENNKNNKYFLSILFNDDKNTYTLNYFTGSDFSSQKESAKDYFSDFTQYLNYDCALFSCSKMDDAALAAKDALGNQVLHVGKHYLGYRQNGDRYYYIPVYNQDGSVTMYSTWNSPLDAYDLNPMEEFVKQVSNPDNEKVFQSSNLSRSENLDKVVSILDECRKLGQSQNQINKSNPDRIK